MARTRKRKQKQTLKEFRAWLQGVEELQPDDWSPSGDQWRLIRDKIDDIILEKEVSVPVQSATNPTYQQPPRIVPPPLPPTMLAPPAGGIPMGDVQMTDAARKMLNPNSNGGKVKTPDIDTSDGNVNSPFA